MRIEGGPQVISRRVRLPLQKPWRGRVLVGPAIRARYLCDISLPCTYIEHQLFSIACLVSGMEFFKSAVASAISKGPPFPYTFGDRVDVDASIWALHNGTKRV
jgi:hypothetical protein